jgi:hypothetical protein
MLKRSEDKAKKMLNEFNKAHTNDFMSGSCDINTFKALVKNHESLDKGKKYNHDQ